MFFRSLNALLEVVDTECEMLNEFSRVLRVAYHE